MKLKLIGNILMIKSEIKKEDFDKVQRVGPEALTVIDDEGNMLYKVNFKETDEVDELSAANIQKFGITFNQVQDGCLAAAVMLPVKASKAEYDEAIQETYGKALVSAKNAEEEIIAQMNQVLETMNSLTADMEVSEV